MGLQVSLLVRSQKTGELFVNFDPQILTQIREVKCMTRMNLEIPHFATVLQQKHDTLKQNYNKLQVILLQTLKSLISIIVLYKVIIFFLFAVNVK